MKLLLDTSTIVALRRGNKSIQRALEARRGHAEEIGISILTQYELLLGASFLWKKYSDAREFAWLDDVFGWLKVYEADGEVVRAAAEVQADALSAGEPLPDMDLLVALSAKGVSELLTLDLDQLKMKGALKAKGAIVSSS